MHSDSEDKTTEILQANETKFDGELKALPYEELCDRDYVQDLSARLGRQRLYPEDKTLSAAKAFTLIRKEHCNHHKGDLFRNSVYLDIYALRPEQLWSRYDLDTAYHLNKWRKTEWGDKDWSELTIPFYDLFGVCPVSTMKHFLTYAKKPPSEPLGEYLGPRLMFIDFALKIREARLKEAS